MLPSEQKCQASGQKLKLDKINVCKIDNLFSLLRRFPIRFSIFNCCAAFFTNIAYVIVKTQFMLFFFCVCVCVFYIKYSNLWFMLSKCFKNHIYEILLTIQRPGMLSIVDIFGRAKDFGYDEIGRNVLFWGYAEICWYCFWVLKSGLRPNPLGADLIKCFTKVKEYQVRLVTR